MEMMQVVVPQGVQPGQTFQIQVPSGQVMAVQAQVGEGQAMQVQVPSSQPVAQPVVVAASPVMVDGFPAQVKELGPQSVVGIPIDVSTFVTSQFGLPIDPVPMLDAQTAGILASVNKFKVKQRLAWMEALTQGACEQSNIYDIFDDNTNQPLFTAVEESDGCTRCCCAPHHSFHLKFKPAAVGVPKSALGGHPTLMTMEREGCCSKWGLGCWACNDDCKDGYFLHAGDVVGEPGKVQMSSGRVMGFATQPSMGGGFTPTVNVMERLDETGSKWGAMAKIEGPQCFGGCSELCCDSAWPVSKMAADDFHNRLFVGDFATITKRKPNGLGAALQEAMTDSDTYTIEFNPNVALAPQQKALMLSSLVQIDFMFFEKDNGMCKSEGGKIKITLFECYCYGCTCPCNLEFGGNNGGGAPPKPDEMER